MGRVEQAILFVVNGEGVEIETATRGLEGPVVGALQLIEEGGEFAGVVARVGDGGDEIGIDGVVVTSAERPGDLDIVGVGLRLKESIHDRHVLVVGIKIYIGAARGQSEKNNENKVEFQSFHAPKIQKSYKLQGFSKKADKVINNYNTSGYYEPSPYIARCDYAGGF